MLVARLTCMRSLPLVGLRPVLSQGSTALRSPILKACPPLLKPQQVVKSPAFTVTEKRNATHSTRSLFWVFAACVCATFPGCITCCFVLFFSSSVRDLQPRPDLGSAVQSLPEINSKKLPSSRRQKRLSKVGIPCDVPKHLNAFPEFKMESKRIHCSWTSFKINSISCKAWFFKLRRQSSFNLCEQIKIDKIYVFWNLFFPSKQTADR